MSFIKPGDVGLFTDLYQLTMAQDYLRSTEIFSSEFLEYLVKYDRRPVLKLSTGKLSLPGEKQVYRVRNGDGKLVGDILALREEPAGSGEPLLVDVMADGKVTMELPSLAEIKERFDQEFSSLDENLKALRPSEHYKVSHSPGLEKLTLEMQNRLKEQTSVTS